MFRKYKSFSGISCFIIVLKWHLERNNRSEKYCSAIYRSKKPYMISGNENAEDMNFWDKIASYIHSDGNWELESSECVLEKKHYAFVSYSFLFAAFNFLLIIFKKQSLMQNFRKCSTWWGAPNVSRYVFFTIIYKLCFTGIVTLIVQIFEQS